MVELARGAAGAAGQTMAAAGHRRQGSEKTRISRGGGGGDGAGGEGAGWRGLLEQARARAEAVGVGS